MYFVQCGVFMWFKGKKNVHYCCSSTLRLSEAHRFVKAYRSEKRGLPDWPAIQCVVIGRIPQREYGWYNMVTSQSPIVLHAIPSSSYYSRKIKECRENRPMLGEKNEGDPTKIWSWWTDRVSQWHLFLPISLKLLLHNIKVSLISYSKS